MNLRFELLYFDSGETPTAVQVQLSADKSFLIGSGESCDLRLQMGGVLSMHCLLEVNAKGGVDVVSVDDTSPVIVNGESALQSPVEDGDRIELGQAALVLRAAPPQPVAAATGSHGSSHGSHGSGSRGSGSHGSGSHGSGSHGSHGAHGGNSSSGLRQALQSAESRAEPVDPLVEETFAELQTTYPEHAARRPAQQQLQLLQRGLTTARSNGFDTPELIKRFLHCVLLLDNDLSKATNSDIAYVLDTLTVPSKSREKRLDRAISLSRRIADQNKDAYKGGAKPVTPKPLDPPIARVLVAPALTTSPIATSTFATSAIAATRSRS